MWHVLHEKVLPYVVLIETPDGFGTGFLFTYNENRSLIGFATAAHVVQHADVWKLPIKIRHHATGNEIFLTEPERLIYVDVLRDSASIVIANKPYDYLPVDPLPMMEATHYRSIGVEIGWVGFPAIALPNLCLFTGRIAAFVLHDDTYLIDGVAINGVSGGPVFADKGEGVPEIIGSISAYVPNRQRGDALPGILRAHDVTAFHETIKELKSLDEARKKKDEEDLQRRQAEAAGEQPPSPTPTSPKEPQPTNES